MPLASICTRPVTPPIRKTCPVPEDLTLAVPKLPCIMIDPVPELETDTLAAVMPYPSKFEVPAATKVILGAVLPGPKIRSPDPSFSMYWTEELVAGVIVSLMALLVLKLRSTLIAKTPLLSTVRDMALMTCGSAVTVAVLVLTAFAAGGSTKTVIGRQDRMDVKAGICSVALMGTFTPHAVEVMSAKVISAARLLAAHMNRVISALS